jgi:hypothetical protein
LPPPVPSFLLPVFASAEPALRTLTSGLRHSFFVTGLSLTRCRPKSYSLAVALTSKNALSTASFHKALVNQVIEQHLKFGGAFFGTDVEFVEQLAPQLVESFGIFEIAPNRRRHGVEAKTIAGGGIERDELIADLGFHQTYGTTIDWTGHTYSNNGGRSSAH